MKNQKTSLKPRKQEMKKEEGKLQFFDELTHFARAAGVQHCCTQ
jgi:hypothetical protein